jgi:hypothetical protein
LVFHWNDGMRPYSMHPRQPSVLRMPDHKKKEMVAAQAASVQIIMARYQQLELLEDRDFPLHVQMRSVSDRLKVFGHYVQFVIGRSQQPLIKGRIREWNVRCESQRIAAETGASFEKVYELFISLMTPYIRTR